VSIKDMNKAFRDEISRIKEKQDETNTYSNRSNSYGDSLDKSKSIDNSQYNIN